MQDGDRDSRERHGAATTSDFISASMAEALLKRIWTCYKPLTEFLHVLPSPKWLRCARRLGRCSVVIDCARSYAPAVL